MNNKHNYACTKSIFSTVLNDFYILTDLVSQHSHKVGTAPVSILQMGKLISKRYQRPSLGPDLVHKGMDVGIQTVWSGLEARQLGCWMCSATKRNVVLIPTTAWMSLENTLSEGQRAYCRITWRGNVYSDRKHRSCCLELGGGQ